MKISARNTLVGKIVEIHEGPVSTEVTIETAAGEKFVSSITTTLARLPRMVPTLKLSILEPFFNVQMPLLRESCTGRWPSLWISRMISGLRMK